MNDAHEKKTDFSEPVHRITREIAMIQMMMFANYEQKLVQILDSTDCESITKSVLLSQIKVCGLKVGTLTPFSTISKLTKFSLKNRNHKFIDVEFGFGFFSAIKMNYCRVSSFVICRTAQKKTKITTATPFGVGQSIFANLFVGHKEVKIDAENVCASIEIQMVECLYVCRALSAGSFFRVTFAPDKRMRIVGLHVQFSPHICREAKKQPNEFVQLLLLVFV